MRDEPAFPGPDYIVKGKLTDEGIFQLGQVRGLTKREYIAIKALQGILANPETDTVACAGHLEEHAVKHADLLLGKLSKEQP